jgi:hypothetical protein
MDIRAEPHFTLTIVISDDEAKAIIVDPDPFLAKLQDAIAPNGDYARRAAQTDSAYRRSSKRVNKSHRGKSLAPKKHCDVCDRDIAAHWFDRHVSKHNDLETGP